ncbi:MAG: hypothetical protein RBT53_08125 [Azonexus sp.]|jgi:hypothetical protein|nr:hypothetical protein [Azonexus sp.]
MTAEAIPTSNTSQSPTGGGLLNFLANALTLAAFLLMAIGLVAATATWQSHTIEFVGADRMRLTNVKWWGLSQTESLYRASPAGWVLLRANGDEVAVALQPIKISE